MCSSNIAPEQEADACWQLVGRGNAEAGSHQFRPLYLLLFIDFFCPEFKEISHPGRFAHALAMWESQVSPWSPRLLLVMVLSFWDSDKLTRQPGSASVLANDTPTIFLATYSSSSEM